MPLIIFSPLAVDDGRVQGERTTEVTRSTVIYHTASPVASPELSEMKHWTGASLL